MDMNQYVARAMQNVSNAVKSIKSPEQRIRDTVANVGSQTKGFLNTRNNGHPVRYAPDEYFGKSTDNMGRGRGDKLFGYEPNFSISLDNMGRGRGDKWFGYEPNFSLPSNTPTSGLNPGLRDQINERNKAFGPYVGLNLDQYKIGDDGNLVDMSSPKPAESDFKSPFENNQKLRRQIDAKNEAFGPYVAYNLDQYKVGEDGNLVDMGLKYERMARDENGQIRYDSNNMPIWEKADPALGGGEWRTEVDKEGNPVSVFATNWKNLENEYNDKVRYNDAADLDSNGVVSDEEIESTLRMLNQEGYNIYDPSPAGYNKTGVYSDRFDIDDDGRLVVYNDYLDRNLVLPESFIDKDTLGQAGGGLNLTLGGEDVGSDELGKRQAEYLLFHGADPYFAETDATGALVDPTSVGDSWAAAQFAVNDRPDVFEPWWEETMAVGSPIDYGFEYIRNRDDLWGEGGYTYDKYKDLNKNMSKDVNAISDPIVYQSLYGSSPTAWNDMNRYLVKEEVPLWYLDALYMDPTRLAGIAGSAEIDNLGRIPITLGNVGELEGAKGRDALNLMNAMVLDTYLGEGIDMGDWTEGMLDRYVDLSGLGRNYDIVGADQANESGDGTEYRNPYRVYGENEIDWDSLLPMYDRERLMGRLSDRLAEQGLGLYSSERQ